MTEKRKMYPTCGWCGNPVKGPRVVQEEMVMHPGCADKWWAKTRSRKK